jgi:hypothetical protein
MFILLPGFNPQGKVFPPEKVYRLIPSLHKIGKGEEADGKFRDPAASSRGND